MIVMMRQRKRCEKRERKEEIREEEEQEEEMGVIMLNVLIPHCCPQNQ